MIRSRAVLVAIGIDWEGRRQVLGVEMANRESSTSWKEFLLSLKRRGLRGVIFAVSDDHPGLKRAIIEVLPEAYWQRCYVHFLRNALDDLPGKIADDCLIECAGFTIDATLRKPAETWRPGCYDGRRTIQSSSHRWKKTLKKPLPSIGYPESIIHILRVQICSSGSIRSSNAAPFVIRIFPNQESCLRLIRAMAVEIHEDWIEAHRYLNMEMLREQRKQLQLLEAA